ncbi:MAG: hypothetical protein ACI4S9_02835 [Christensenellales bacterium]
MNFSKELLEKAKTAKNAEELLEMAKAENIEISAEQAKEYFATIHASGELSDEELDNVSGGCGGPDYKYNVGDSVLIYGKRFSYHVLWRYRSYPAGIIFYNCANSYFPEDEILVRESAIEGRGQIVIPKERRDKLREEELK